MKKMKKIKIYTISDKRPDLIPIQYKSIISHVKDECEFIVLNNSVDDKNRFDNIQNVCNSINIKSIPVELDSEFQYMNGEIHYDNGKYLNPNLACAYPMIWSWQKIITEDDSISVIIDSDMFFIKDVSIHELMQNHDFAFVPHYRGNMEIFYPWNGIVISNIPNMPNPKEMNWGCGLVNNIPVDVGGQGHFYLKKYKNNLKSLYLSQFAILEDMNLNSIKTNLNGSFDIFIDIQSNKVNIPVKPYSDKKIFPHEIERENIWNYPLSFLFSMLKWTNKFNFPKPTFVDLIKVENDDSIDQSFIFHYKAGSNYMPWATQEYNELKTESLFKVLQDKFNNYEKNL